MMGALADPTVGKVLLHARIDSQMFTSAPICERTPKDNVLKLTKSTAMIPFH